MRPPCVKWGRIAFPKNCADDEKPPPLRVNPVIYSSFRGSALTPFSGQNRFYLFFVSFVLLSSVFMQLKSKSLNHLDNLDSEIGTQTEHTQSPKPVLSSNALGPSNNADPPPDLNPVALPLQVDYLDVEPSIVGCLSTSPTSSTASSMLHARMSSCRSLKKKKKILSRSEVSIPPPPHSDTHTIDTAILCAAN